MTRVRVSLGRTGIESAELKVSLHALLLTHLAVQVHQGHTRSEASEGLVHEPDLFLTRKEDECFLLQVSLDEGPQQIGLLIQLALNVVLFELLWRDPLSHGVH